MDLKIAIMFFEILNFGKKLVLCLLFSQLTEITLRCMPITNLKCIMEVFVLKDLKKSPILFQFCA